jgi:hypothetical protein
VLFVAKGKTARSRQGFGDICPHWVAHSEKGWMTGELLIDALRWTRELRQLADRAKVALSSTRGPAI